MEVRDRNGLTEQEFLKTYRQKEYPHPYLTADFVMVSEQADRVLLIRRKGHPFLGKWAIPGGFVNPDESAFDAALRELEEETCVTGLPEDAITEIGLFSKPGRDPRGWIVSDAFVVPVDPNTVHARAADDAADALWFTIEPDETGAILLKNGDLLLTEADLAFDHADVLRRALQIIRPRKEHMHVSNRK